ncbi:MAG: DEAD/DEAH box helicase [Bdellovibrionota bacterium]
MKSFNELPLSPELSKAIKDLGYETPSEIQAQALPILLAGPTDFIGLAATGTGKTAAFSVPMLEQVDPAVRKVQCLILCPTRELALQVSGQINLLGKYKNLQALPVYGGSSYRDQLDGLRKGTQIVVGTPGRVVDHIERGTLKLESVTHIILDEADEMISMGFKDDLETILAAIPKEKAHTWLFSATMSRDVRGVADKYLKKPKQVQVNKNEMLASTVTQLYYMTREGNKPEILCKMIDVAEDFYGIIFCQTKQLVADLTTYLNQRGYRVDCLHGDKDQKSRERTMQSFRDHKVKILVCTDVASRGLDVKDITHVINYSLPRELDSYVHRIGRTARSGKQGFAMSLVTPAQKTLVFRIEKMTRSRMQEGLIPTRKEVGRKKLSMVLPHFQNEKNSLFAKEILDQPWKDALENLTKEDIAARFLAMMNPVLFSEVDTNPRMPGPPQRDEASGTGRSGEAPRRDYARRSSREASSYRRESPRREYSRDEAPRAESSSGEKPRSRYSDERRRPVSEGVRYSRPRKAFGSDGPGRSSSSRHER